MNADECFLKSLLSKRLRIKIKDGRIMDGNLMCTDDGCNIVISNCEEFLTQSDVDAASSNSTTTSNIRTLGMAIVPGDQITSISIADELLPAEVLAYINGEIKSIERSADIEPTRSVNIEPISNVTEHFDNST